METVAINYESKFASCVSCPAVFSENIQRGARALIRHANSASEKAVMKNTREYNSNKRFTLERNVSLIESRTVALKNKWRSIQFEKDNEILHWIFGFKICFIIFYTISAKYFLRIVYVLRILIKYYKIILHIKIMYELNRVFVNTFYIN